jgi:all-trans-8'-apo-beta-carotenal 15,15'-oxygenase
MATAQMPLTSGTAGARTSESWKGLFDTVSECDKIVTDIEGQLPEGLAGTLYRNGPGTHDWTDSFFDGDGLIRAIHIGEDGSVRYQARYVETEKYRKERAAKKQLYRLAGTNRPGGILANMFRPPAHEANTNVIHMADRIWALEEGGHPYEIDAKTLATGEMTDFDGQLHARTAFTAHPHFDPDSGDGFGFGMHFGSKQSLKLFRVDPSARLHHIGEIPISGAGFVHDYALSKEWMAFFMPPMIPSIAKILLGTGTFFDSLRWEPERGLKIALMRRSGGKPIYLEEEACLAGHVIGARDVGGELIVDLCRQPEWKCMSEPAANFRTADWAGYGLGGVRRYRIDPSAGTVKTEEICDLPAEFPRINSRYESVGARYGYFAANTRPGEGGWFRGVLKLDLETGATDSFDYGETKAAHESVFVPRPTSAGGTGAEDDGWLMGFVHDGLTSQTEVAILDARRVADGPVCTLKLRENAGITFHGNWVPSA